MRPVTPPLSCPACGTRLPLADIETGADGQARTRCPSCRAALVWDIRVEREGPGRDGRDGPALSPEARLAALGDAARPPSRPPLAGLRRLAGLLVCLLLLVALLAQHAGFRTATWIANARLRPVIQGVCAELGCRLPLPREPSYLRVVERHVGPLPGIPGALRVELVFQNTAPFAMPAPWLDITFFDALRRPVAGRRFRAPEYLPADLPADQPLAAGQAIRSRIDIVDPGESALGFEFRFGYDPDPGTGIQWPGLRDRWPL